MRSRGAGASGAKQAKSDAARVAEPVRHQEFERFLAT